MQAVRQSIRVGKHAIIFAKNVSSEGCFRSAVCLFTLRKLRTGVQKKRQGFEEKLLLRLETMQTTTQNHEIE